VDVADEDVADEDVADEDVADEDVADEDVEEGHGAGDAAAAAADEVDDDDRGLLEMEVSLQTNRGRKREANQRLTEILALLEDIDEEFAQQAETYASRLPHAQAEVFRNARSVEGYLESVTRFRRRRTMPRTYGDFDPYTYNL
jgi:hypothetical protein